MTEEHVIFAKRNLTTVFSINYNRFSKPELSVEVYTNLTVLVRSSTLTEAKLILRCGWKEILRLVWLRHVSLQILDSLPNGKSQTAITKRLLSAE